MSEDSHGEVPDGIDAEGVTRWLVTHAAEVAPPLRFELITGGHSNLTFLVSDGEGRRWVLRRPPLKQVLATAHDMGREHRVISALGPTPVPVPGIVGLCTDESVTGAPFYVMDFVEGHVLRTAADTEVLDEPQRRRAGESIVDVLAAIHAVDIDAVGLGDFAKREDYLTRQLNRWWGQFEKSTNREVPVVREVYEALLAAVPPQGDATIVHGDYRLDNCLVSGDGDVVAVLDWEICTLGDPLADIGLLLVYWGDPDDPTSAQLPSPTMAPGFPTPAEVLARYGEASGRDLGPIDVYVAFGYWKLACIIEGVYSRYTGGAMGTRDASGFEYFGQLVLALGDRARTTLDRLG